MVNNWIWIEFLNFKFLFFFFMLYISLKQTEFVSKFFVFNRITKIAFNNGMCYLYRIINKNESGDFLSLSITHAVWRLKCNFFNQTHRNSLFFRLTFFRLLHFLPETQTRRLLLDFGRFWFASYCFAKFRRTKSNSR